MLRLWKAWLHLLRTLHAHNGQIRALSLRGVPTCEYESICTSSGSFSIILRWPAVSMRMGGTNAILHRYGTWHLIQPSAATSLTTGGNSWCATATYANDISVRSFRHSFLTASCDRHRRNSSSIPPADDGTTSQLYTAFDGLIISVQILS